jgi:hypothetical protein
MIIEKIDMKLQGCEKHLDRTDLPCYRIRHDDGSRMTDKEILERFSEMLSLIDGAYNIVELWDAKSPSKNNSFDTRVPENKNFENNNEIRIWPQITLYQNIGSLRVEQRYRSESRFTTRGYRNRFRYRCGLSYPFGKEAGADLRRP